jgi:2-C-methyl-D-erythritol 4-phosphate cytidylyltransferase
MKKYAVIVAAGSGVRMGTDIPKQFLLLQNKPLLWHTLTAFLDSFDDMEIILVLPASHGEMGKAIVESLAQSQRVQLTTGGTSRFQSVKNGLKLVGKDAVVFVHDGVRCLVSPALIQRCYAITIAKGNAVPAVKPADSIRIEAADGNNKIVDRNTIRIIQTPQTFLSNILLPAFEQEEDELFTDEASVVERTGVSINLVEGEAGNIKITQATDLLLAENVLAGKSFQYKP